MPSLHTLSRAVVKRNVDEDIGTYALYDEREGPPEVVGRASDLRKRLYDLVDDHWYFSFEHHPNVTEAYRHEVELYHEHGGKERLENEQHPRRPHTNVKCHLCDVHE